MPNQGTAWQFTLDQLSQFFERVATVARETRPSHPAPIAPNESRKVRHARRAIDRADRRILSTSPEYWASERQSCTCDSAANRADAGVRSQTVREAVSAVDLPVFPQPDGKAVRTVNAVPARACSETARPLAETIVRQQGAILERFRAVLEPSIGGQRIRCHGDYQLGQLLHTGKDFVIIDCEGDTTRTIGERRVKRRPCVTWRA